MKPILALLISTASVWGADAINEWDNLRELRAGQQIEVIDMKLKSQRGAFTALSSEGIGLAPSKGEITVERANVLRVTLREGSKRLRNTLLGAAIGAAAGGAVMAVWVRRAQPIGEFRGEYYDVGKWIFLPAGLGAGAAIGAATPGYRTLYRATKPPPAPAR